MPPFILSLLANHYVRDGIAILLLLLACWAGWHYVQELRADNKALVEQVGNLNNKIHNLDDIQKAQQEVHAAEQEANAKLQAAIAGMQRDFNAYKLRNAVSIPELVRTDPAKAQQRISDEYKYRLECLEFVSGKTFPVEELKLIAPYCAKVQK